ncbi:hypothetical protein Tco_0619548 [Tanacetum coccineum]
MEGKEKRAGTELVQEITKKKKVEDDKEIAELKQRMEIIPDEEEVAIDAIPLADRKSQMYMIYSHMLKSFDREDLEDLYKLVKAKYESTRPVEDLDLILWDDLKTILNHITFLDDATCADLYVGREEVSPCTTYTFNDVGKEAYD